MLGDIHGTEVGASIVNEVIDNIPNIVTAPPNILDVAQDQAATTKTTETLITTTNVMARTTQVNSSAITRGIERDEILK